MSDTRLGWVFCLCLSTFLTDFVFLWTEIYEIVPMESLVEDVDEHLAAEVEEKYQKYLAKSGQERARKNEE